MLILVYGNQAMATAGPDLGDRSVTSGTISSDTCQTCLTPITDITATPTPNTDADLGFLDQYHYYQTIITEQNPPTLTCPDGFTCGDQITGPTFIQLEYTDGLRVWFNTIKSDTPTIMYTDVGTLLAQPLHLFHTQAGLTLKPGQHLITTYGDTLANFASNLNLDPTKLIADPAYLDLNQQSESEQKIHRNVVDAEIAGVTHGGDAKLSAQMNSPLYNSFMYKLNVRILTNNGWSDFTSDDHNQLVAAAKLDNGYCPEVESPLYQNNFDADSDCLRITIQDGGPNDGDGETNGSVALTLGLVFKEAPVIAEPLKAPNLELQIATAQNNGGGGVWSWWLSLALLLRINSRRGITA